MCSIDDDGSFPPISRIVPSLRRACSLVKFMNRESEYAFQVVLAELTSFANDLSLSPKVSILVELLLFRTTTVVRMAAKVMVAIKGIPLNFILEFL